MAAVYAFDSTNMLDFNFNRVYSGSYYYNTYQGFTFNNIFYADVLEVFWETGGFDFASYFGGYNLTYYEAYGRMFITGGTATGYIETYFDGAYYQPYFMLEQFSVSAVELFNAFATPSNADDIELVEAVLSQSDTLGGSPYQDTLTGYAGDDFIWGESGDDVLIGGRGNDLLDGGFGIDTAYYAEYAMNYAVIVDATNFIIHDKTGISGTDTGTNIEKIEFFYNSPTIDLTSYMKTASLSQNQITSLIELYIASFNRAPDSSGLNYWGSRLADGMSLSSIAKSFFEQPETQAAYPTSLGNVFFINTVYENVLGRAPDQAGMNYWLSDLNNGVVSKDLFLLAVINAANSPTGGPNDKETLENKTLVGADYALAQGLNNLHWGKDVMSGVTYNTSTVNEAMAMIDDYALIAASYETSELTISTNGLWDFMV